MRQRGYVMALIVLVLAACAGGFFGGRFLLRRLQQDFQPRAVWMPPTLVPSTGPTGLATMVAMATPGPIGTPLTTIPAPVIDASVAPRTVTPTTVTTLEPTPVAAETPAVTPSATPVWLFDLQRPLRHSAGDCPGNYVLGQVLDRFGHPLPEVRLSLRDEYGNVQSTLTKSGTDAGRYDFPLFGPPRRFYLAVVDDAGRPVSPEIEISHGLGLHAPATCHWADWQQE